MSPSEHESSSDVFPCFDSGVKVAIKHFAECVAESADESELSDVSESSCDNIVSSEQGSEPLLLLLPPVEVGTDAEEELAEESY